ncbi:unnamed protein product [Caenorhabditis bovis]|uniref:Uncharacterized protein n=1 Tax=Caenorhabditis bovis TaxID=2654633 RepID=A0A8S1FBA8_9PELO|nr:unnamed protein product [Caenorhabditis bovis]
MSNRRFLSTVLVLTFATLIVSFEYDKKMNPILRHFAQQDRLKPLMQALRTSKSETEGYRNCYLSPIQCHLPARREPQQQQLSVLDDDEMNRFRRMLFPTK